jgi:hypothetical protein
MLLSKPCRIVSGRMRSFRMLSALLLLTAGPAVAQQLSSFESAVYKELNALRRNPAEYIVLLQDQRRFYRGRLLEFPGQISLQTTEGVSAVDEAINALRSLKRSLGPVRLSEGLTRAAEEHVHDTGARGIVGHTGSRGTDPATRISHFGNWTGSVSEDISYGQADPPGVIMQFLIDDGVRNRGHRDSILNPQWRFAGVACGSHSRYGHMCVIDFASSYDEILR